MYKAAIVASLMLAMMGCETIKPTYAVEVNNQTEFTVALTIYGATYPVLAGDERVVCSLEEGAYPWQAELRTEEGNPAVTWSGTLDDLTRDTGFRFYWDDESEVYCLQIY